MDKQYYVYMLSNKSNSVLHIGMTRHLERRVYEHKHKLIKGFTEKYNADRLVYLEIYDDAYTAASRERQLKGWRREKKNQLIEKLNPDWKEITV